MGKEEEKKKGSGPALWVRKDFRQYAKQYFEKYGELHNYPSTTRMVQLVFIDYLRQHRANEVDLAELDKLEYNVRNSPDIGRRPSENEDQ